MIQADPKKRRKKSFVVATYSDSYHDYIINVYIILTYAVYWTFIDIHLRKQVFQTLSYNNQIEEENCELTIIFS